eukprot:9151742-Heterocapsa_arctica.AAC.1
MLETSMIRSRGRKEPSLIVMSSSRHAAPTDGCISVPLRAPAAASETTSDLHVALGRLDLRSCHVP